MEKNFLFTKIITINDLDKYLNNNSFLVDIRDKRNYDYGHIPGAINMTEKEIFYHINELKEKDNIVVYCEYGNAGLRLVEDLIKKHKVTNFYNIIGGYNVYRGKIEKNIN